MYIASDGREFDVVTPSSLLLQLLEAQVDQALYVGTGREATCDDAEALATSCFLCEACNLGRRSVDPRGHFRNLSSKSDFCLVAVEGETGSAVRFWAACSENGSRTARSCSTTCAWRPPRAPVASERRCSVRPSGGRRAWLSMSRSRGRRTRPSSSGKKTSVHFTSG